MTTATTFCCYHLVRPYAPYEVAYVGIGRAGRPHEHAVMAARRSHYNKILQRIFDKARRAGYEALTVIVVANGLTWAAACQREKEEIALYGRLDLKTGCLANQTPGGDGVTGPKTKEHLAAIGDALREQPKSETHRNSLKAAHAREGYRELRQNLARAQHARMTEEENRARSALISRRTKERMAELGCSARISEALSGRTHDDARRALTSESVRRAYQEKPELKENL